jgi:hypothetical protein
VLRRGPIGVHLFGVPLNRKDPAPGRLAFGRFDQSIVAPAGRNQTLAQFPDSLVVHGIHRDLSRPEGQSCTASWLEAHPVSACIPNILGAMVDRSGPLRREILKQGPAKRH